MNRSIQLYSIFQPGLWLWLLIWLPSGYVFGGECPPGDEDPNGHHDVKFIDNPAADFTCENYVNDCDLTPMNSSDPICTYSTEVGGNLNSETISAEALPLGSSLPNPDVGWVFESLEGACAPGSQNCIGITIDTASETVDFSGVATAGAPYFGCFRLTATSADISCSRSYRFQITSSPGGWGDPHITTVDGVNYDFQSAGEFIALRGEGLEIQTRQTPVSTSHVPGPNGYTDIASCVSIYTAVAARVGDYRVTIQPNLSGEPDPSGMQIRVDGKLRTLGPNGIDLSSCNCSTDDIKSGGRIVRSADEQSVEVHYPDDTKLVVTPAWSNNMKKWYMNINVYDTTATEGVMGRVADRWLPALSDGTSVGPKAASTDERYKQLNEIFADSWRVTDETSLFDYAEDSSTDSFTLQSWPRSNPDSCLLEGEPVMVSVDEAVAEEVCSIVMDENNRANCIFDVRETGIFGFADAYARSERIIPGDTRTVLVQDENRNEYDSVVIFTASVQRTVSTVGKINSGVVQFLLDGERVGDPTEFDFNRHAVWRASQLSRGVHTLEAKYLPSGFGERFRPSSSKVEFKF